MSSIGQSIVVGGVAAVGAVGGIGIALGALAKRDPERYLKPMPLSPPLPEHEVATTLTFPRIDGPPGKPRPHKRRADR